MKILIGNLHTVNGELFRDIVWAREDDPEKLPVHEAEEIYTPHCGWMPYEVFPTCTKACTLKCKIARDVYDEFDIEY